MKNKLLAILAACLLTASAAQAQSEENLKLHFDFSSVAETAVTDNVSGVTAKLAGAAKVVEMGSYRVLDLCNGSGYLDMTAAAGDVLAAQGNYSISVYYRVDEDASLSGNGYFLWAFSTSAACTATAGAYTAYRLNAQRVASSTGGYQNEKGDDVGTASPKGRWMHVCYTQQATTGRLYIDGQLQKAVTTMPTNKALYGSAKPTCCWIGRAPFSGDNYLRKTLVADFRLYAAALTATQVSELAAKTVQLDYAFEHGTPGDMTALQTAIAQAQTAVGSAADDCLPGAVANVEDMLMLAQTIVADGTYGQTVLDRMTAQLKAAVTAMKATAGKLFDTSDVEAAGIYDTNRGFRHPGGMHTQQDFDRIKAQLAAGNTTVKAAYNLLKNAAYAQPGVQTYPVESIVRGGSGENYINAARGATMAYQNALRWKIEDNEQCAKAAVRILMAWANTTKQVTGSSDQCLAVGLYGYQFAQAAELMRDYEGWKRDDFETFRRWMLRVWYYPAIGFLRSRNGTWENTGKWWKAPGHYWSNWGLCNALCVISIGILCDDVHIYNQGMSFMKYDQVGTFRDPRTANPILNDGLTEFIGNLVVTTSPSDLETGAYGRLGQTNESGRDVGHPAMALGLAIDIAHTAWNQGDDLFSYMDNRLAAGIEYVAAQVLGTEGLPWTDYSYGTNGIYYTDSRCWTMTEPCLGVQIRPCWGTVVGHYEGVKGVTMPYSEKVLKRMGTDGGGTGGTSGSYDQLGYSVLMNTRDEQLCPANRRPTPLTPRITFERTTTSSHPSKPYSPLLKDYGTTIDHSELGGLKNDYTTDNQTGLPRGSIVTLQPQLPDGEADTGQWQWNTGESTRNITVTADRSFMYRATYTNSRGVKSEQLFSIAVQGDCEETPGVTPFIIYKGKTLDNEATISVDYGEEVTLGISGTRGFDTFLWDDGTTGSTVTKTVTRNRDVQLVYQNQGGRKTLFTFHLETQPPLTRGDVNGDGVVNIVDVTLAIGQILGQPTPTPITGTADINGDGKVDDADLEGILGLVMDSK